MKHFSLLSFVFIGFIFYDAKSATVVENMGLLPKEHCVEIKHLRWSIIQKLSKNEYLATGDGTASFGYAVIKTKKANYSSTGIPIGISLKKTGSKKIQLSNGFTKTASTWIECSYDTRAECAVIPPGRLVRPDRTNQKSCN